MSSKLKYIAIVIFLCLALSGCSESPSKVVAKFMDQVKTMDLSQIEVQNQPYGLPIDTAGMEPQVRDIAKSLLGQMTYAIGKTTVNGSRAEVELQITTIDTVKVMGEVVVKTLGLMVPDASGAVMSQAELEKRTSEMMVAAFKDANAPKVTSTVTMKLDKVDGSWVMAEASPTDAEAFADALTGNLISLIKSMVP